MSFTLSRKSLERGALSASLTNAFVEGTAVGGARPKVLVQDSDSSWIAKLSMSVHPHPVVKAEGAAMALTSLVGLEVPRTQVTRSLGRDVLLVERFDRPVHGHRRMMVSALTMHGFGDFLGARYSSYVELLAVLRRHGRHGEKAGSNIFECIVFTNAIGNIDDHARNHAAFWDGEQLELTPTYDLCPQLRQKLRLVKPWTSPQMGNATASSPSASPPQRPTGCPSRTRALVDRDCRRNGVSGSTALTSG